MSYKDLERNIRAALDAFKAEFDAKVAKKESKKADKKAKKAAKEVKARLSAKPPMFRPDPPVKHEMLVVLNLRYAGGGQIGELEEKEFTVETLSELEAELEAIRRAQRDEYIWRGTVSVTKIS